MMENEERRKRSREEVSEPEEEVEKPEEKGFHSDILRILEDDDDEAESTSDSGAEELLNSVMRSLQDEINPEKRSSTETDGARQPGFGYLLEASDDEFGLRTTGPGDNEDAVGDVVAPSLDWDSGGCWDFDDGLPGFAFPEGGFAGDEEEVLVFDDLFGYSDYSQICSWRSEYTPAV